MNTGAPIRRDLASLNAEDRRIYHGFMAATLGVYGSVLVALLAFGIVNASTTQIAPQQPRLQVVSVKSR